MVVALLRAILLLHIAKLALMEDQATSIPSGLFLLESSGRETINARQACAVESAALQSGFRVILVMTATQLDLRDNTTCYLYMHDNKVKFYTVDVMAFSLNSPLGKSLCLYNMKR